MLRAGAFAATAFEAVARLSVAFCVDLIIVVLTVMAVMYLHCIQAGEEVRNADVLRHPSMQSRTAVSLCPSR